MFVKDFGAASVCGGSQMIGLPSLDLQPKFAGSSAEASVGNDDQNLRAFSHLDLERDLVCWRHRRPT